MIIKRILAVFLALSLLMTVAGCGTTTLTSEEIVSNTIGAYKDVTSVKMAMDTTMDMEVTGGEQPMNLHMDIDTTGSIAIKDIEMAMLANADMDVPELGQQTMSTEIYIVDGWMYMKLDIPVVGEQWIKSELDDAMWAQQNQLDQQIALLQTALEVTTLDSESVDGTDCFVLEITPDMMKISEFINSQLGQQTSNESLKDVDISKVFKDLTLKEWIAKDTYLPVKMEMSISLEMNASEFGDGSNDFEKMTMAMTTTIKYFDYNKPVSIVLPAGAANAIEQSLTR